MRYALRSLLGAGQISHPSLILFNLGAGCMERQALRSRCAQLDSAQIHSHIAQHINNEWFWQLWRVGGVCASYLKRPILDAQWQLHSTK